MGEPMASGANSYFEQLLNKEYIKPYKALGKAKPTPILESYTPASAKPAKKDEKPPKTPLEATAFVDALNERINRAVDEDNSTYKEYTAELDKEWNRTLDSVSSGYDGASKAVNNYAVLNYKAMADVAEGHYQARTKAITTYFEALKADPGADKNRGAIESLIDAGIIKSMPLHPGEPPEVVTEPNPPAEDLDAEATKAHKTAAEKYEAYKKEKTKYDTDKAKYDEWIKHVGTALAPLEKEALEQAKTQRDNDIAAVKKRASNLSADFQRNYTKTFTASYYLGFQFKKRIKAGRDQYDREIASSNANGTTIATKGEYDKEARDNLKLLLKTIEANDGYLRLPKAGGYLNRTLGFTDKLKFTFNEQGEVTGISTGKLTTENAQYKIWHQCRSLRMLGYSSANFTAKGKHVERTILIQQQQAAEAGLTKCTFKCIRVVGGKEVTVTYANPEDFTPEEFKKAEYQDITKLNDYQAFKPNVEKPLIETTDTSAIDNATPDTELGDANTPNTKFQKMKEELRNKREEPGEQPGPVPTNPSSA